MCNELQVAAFQISRAETDLTPEMAASLLRAFKRRWHRGMTMRRTQRPTTSAPRPRVDVGQTSRGNRPLRQSVRNSFKKLLGSRHRKELRRGWPLSKFRFPWKRSWAARMLGLSYEHHKAT